MGRGNDNASKAFPVVNLWNEAQTARHPSPNAYYGAICGLEIDHGLHSSLTSRARLSRISSIHAARFLLARSATSWRMASPMFDQALTLRRRGALFSQRATAPVSTSSGDIS